MAWWTDTQHISTSIHIYIYGAGGGSLEGGKKKTVPKKNL
jgi:hypothetical protein